MQYALIQSSDTKKILESTIGIHANTLVKQGDIFQLNQHRIMCGDSTKEQDISRLMNGNLADLILTDPPYGVSYNDKNVFLNEYDKGNCIQIKIENDDLPLDKLYSFIKSVFKNLHKVCSNKSSYYCFTCQGGDKMMMMMGLNDSEWKVKHEIIWVKNNHVLGRSDYKYKHEPIIYGWKKQGTHLFYGGFQTSILFFDKPQKNDLHPTQKPINLFSFLIKNSSKINDLIIDPFLGSGTALIACELHDRVCYGIEISADYVDMIIRRYMVYMNKLHRDIDFSHVNGNLTLDYFRKNL